MKRICIKALIIAAVLITALIPAAVFAADVTAEASATSVAAGDNVTLTVTVSGSGITAVSGAFTYDPAVLTFVSASGGASDGILSMASAEKGGSASLTAVINFVAAASGEAVINVSVEKAMDYSGGSLGSGEAAVSIAVSGEDAPGESPNEPVDRSKTGVEAHNVKNAANTMYIWRSLESLTLPGGYADKQVQYGGEFVGGAMIPDTEYPTLLYLSEANGDNAGYYIYDSARDLLYPYYTLTSVRKVYTLMEPEEGIAVPEGFSASELAIKEKKYPAWLPEGGDGSVYLVYAKDPVGRKAFCLYSPEDESMQLYIPLAAVADPLPSQASAAPADASSNPVIAEADSVSIPRTLFYIACGAAVLLLAMVIYFVVMLIVRTSKKTSRRRSREE